MERKWLSVSLLVVCGCAEFEAGQGFEAGGKSTDCGEPDPDLRFDVPSEHATIQAGIDAAAAAYGSDPANTYTVCVASGTYAEALSVPASNLRLVSVNGSGGTTIDASGESASAAWIDADVVGSFTMEGFTVTGGTGSPGDPDMNGLCGDENDGGGIFADDNEDQIENDYVFSDLVITGNSASDDGGGMYLGSIESATLASVEMTGNTAGSSGGGARFSMTDAIEGGSVTWAGGMVSDNLVDGSFCAGTSAGHDFAGGGIGVRDGSLSLDQVDITGNVALSTTPTRPSSGGGISAFQTELTLENLVVDGNLSTYVTTTTSGPSSAAHDGGGIAAAVGESPVSLSGVVVSQNAADDDGGGLALDFIGNGSVSLHDTVVELNTAALGGGLHVARGATLMRTPRVDLINTAVTDNSASVSGGGIYSDHVAVRLRNSVYGFSSITSNHADGEGGGAYLTSDSDSQLITLLSSLGSGSNDNTAGSGNSDVSLAGTNCTGYGALTSKTFTGNSGTCP